MCLVQKNFLDLVQTYHYRYFMPPALDIPAKVAALRKFFRQYGRPPSFSEARALFGYKSNSPVQSLLRRLEALGYVLRGENGRIAFTSKISGEIKLLGAVSAGFPSPAEEETVDLLNLTDFLVRRREATYILKVDGDSMIGALIGPGDLLIVERGRTPKSGDIVVAAVDGDWTVKYFEKVGRAVRLIPANKKYRPIVPKQSLEIGGIVRAVIRKYGA